MIKELDEQELMTVDGGLLPLAYFAFKAFMVGASVAAVYLAAEDLSGQPGHNHYGK